MTTPTCNGHSSGASGLEPLSNMSDVLTHRLSSLVNIIEGYTDLLTDTLHTREQREMAFRIFESAAGIDRILSDLQRFNQPIEPVFQTCRAEALVEGCLAALEPAQADRVAVTFARSGQKVVADPMLLRQALLVLIQNALDATESPRSVELNLASSGGARFEVRNAGVIALETSEKMFEPFFTTKAHNLGVGLTLARTIAKEHEGSLQLAENTAVQGTCFALELPPLDPA